MKLLTYQTSHLRIVSEKVNLSNYYYLLVIATLIFILIINTSYLTSYNYLLIKDEEYKLIVDDNYFPVKNKYLYYNHKKYRYSVVSISDSYIVSDKKYYDVVIDITFNSKEKNIYNVQIIKSKSTLLSDFLKKIKKG